ncbi:MAG: hypothetical protein IKF38_07235 [Clostridia bacterium]|nr:hypothetical protein [Clostridia bacterium]
MKRIGFIGAYDKIDMIMYAAKILTICGKKVLVADSTINQKARYIIPAINPSSSYITDFEDIDVAVGFTSFGQIQHYLNTESDLEYDVMLIDLDNPYNIEGFGLNTTEKNYFVTGFDLFSIKRGMQIISLIQNPVKLSKILYSQNMTKEESDYLEYLALGYKAVWDENNIYFPIENGDLTVIAENQRSSRINFKRLSQEYKEALLVLVDNMNLDLKENQIRRAIKLIEGNKKN